MKNENETLSPWCITEGEAHTLLEGAPWKRYVVVGDSIAVGTGDPSPGFETLPWAARVARSLRSVSPDLFYLNLGITGLTTRQIIDTQVDIAVSNQPDLIHIAAGGNDLWAAQPDFDGLERDLRELVSRLNETGAQLVTFAFADVFKGPVMLKFRDRFMRLNDLTRSISSDFDVLLLDMWTHPIGDGPSILSADNIHLAMNGQAVFAAEMVKTLSGHLGRTIGSDIKVELIK